MHAAFLERQAGARDEISHGIGDERLARTRQSSHARADVNGDPTELLSNDLAFASMAPGTYFDAERADARRDRLSAANGSGRAIERRKEAVARRIDLASTKAHELSASQVVVAVEQLVPAMVAKVSSVVGGSHDVGEEHSRENALRLTRLARSGQELPDLVEHGVRITGPE